MSTLTKLQYGQHNAVEHKDYTSDVFIDFQNNRLKLLDYSGDVSKIAKNTIALCGKYGMGKIIATVPIKDRQLFFDNGFVQEALIYGYFKGQIGCNVSFFYDKDRAISHRIQEENQIIKRALENKGQYEPMENNTFRIRSGNVEDAKAMAQLYDTVFQSYPTPMDNPEYIKNMIRNDQVLFKVVENDNKIVSAASADLNHRHFNAEMTDCATLPEFRGKGLLSELIYYLEGSLKEKKFMCLYSIARALSPGINIVFSKHGYEFTGRQIKNSQIMGKLEDMNIWVKKI
ncbi:MAG: putative beta-lysine N-acetyltransferase [Eubacteriales bacterium]